MKYQPSYKRLLSKVKWLIAIDAPITQWIKVQSQPRFEEALRESVEYYAYEFPVRFRAYQHYLLETNKKVIRPNVAQPGPKAEAANDGLPPSLDREIRTRRRIRRMFTQIPDKEN